MEEATVRAMAVQWEIQSEFSMAGLWEHWLVSCLDCAMVKMWELEKVPCLDFRLGISLGGQWEDVLAFLQDFWMVKMMVPSYGPDLGLV